MAVDFTSPQGFRRAATAADQAAVHAIYAHPDVAPMLGREPLSLADFGPLYADLCSRRTFYVYLIDSTIVGCYHLSRQSGHAGLHGYLSTLAIAPSWQGRGLGRRMLLEMLMAMRDAGMRKLELIVDSRNTKALALYRSLGATIERTLHRSSASGGIDDHYLVLVP